MPAFSLEEIAERFDLRLRGSASQRMVGVCTLANGSPDRLSYLSDAKHAPALEDTRAGAVILTEDAAARCAVPTLIAKDPKLAYSKVGRLFLPPPPPPGIHPSAVVAEDASIDASVSIGANAVVGEGVRIGASSVLGAGSVVEAGAVIGANSTIGANAVIGYQVTLGDRVRIGAGTVIGDRGFGLTHDGQSWQPVPQLGAVSVGDDVEIGASSTVDRGAIEDTVIGVGVKIDDQVHIAHNCRIGAHTVIAGCTGVAGSTNIGANCVIGGAVGIKDHMNITDRVMLTAATQVGNDINQPGIYSSNFRAMPVAEWNKRLALFRKLDQMEKRLRDLQQQMEANSDSQP